MRYLVFGGCGFLGSNLADDALTRGGELCIFDDLTRAEAAVNLQWLREKDDFDFVEGDVRNPSAVERAVREFRPGAIYHLASQVAMTTSIEDPRRDFEINALGTLNVLEAARKYSPETAIIYSSTNKVYGSLDLSTDIRITFCLLES